MAKQKEFNQVYQVLSTRTFVVNNTYSAQNLLYELTDVMSKYRDSEIRVHFEVKDYYGNDDFTEVLMSIVKEKR